jgi:hypothetical protein
MGILSGLGKAAAKTGRKAKRGAEAAKRAAGIARAKKLAADAMAAAAKKKPKPKPKKKPKPKAKPKTDAQIERELARVDPGTPPGPPVKSVGIRKKGLTEEITDKVIRPSNKPTIKDPIAGKKAKGGTPEAKALIAKVARERKKKLQRAWDDLTASQQRAQRVKGKDSKYWTIFPEHGGGAKVRKGSGASRLSKKGKAMEPGTFAHGGLASKGHKDYRKGGLFY